MADNFFTVETPRSQREEREFPTPPHPIGVRLLYLDFLSPRRPKWRGAYTVLSNGCLVLRLRKAQTMKKGTGYLFSDREWDTAENWSQSATTPRVRVYPEPSTKGYRYQYSISVQWPICSA